MDVGIVASFAAGTLSFLSPCILPLVPPYLCFLAGTSLEQLTRDRAAAPRVLSRAASFVLGFGLVFVVLGAGATWLGRLVADHLALLSRLAGLVIIGLGLHMLGAFRVMVLMRQAKFSSAQPAGTLGAFAVGLAFGFGWTPCVGPVLASILLLAGTEDSVGEGVALLAAYAAGLGVPFLIAAVFAGPFLGWLAAFRRHARLIESALGAGLVGTGVLLFLGLIPALSGWLVETIPVLGRIG
jgi:cytochrome c-type biogenesis protein